jgi:hypothetical protein
LHEQVSRGHAEQRHERHDGDGEHEEVPEILKVTTSEQWSPIDRPTSLAGERRGDAEEHGRTDELEASGCERAAQLSHPSQDDRSFTDERRRHGQEEKRRSVQPRSLSSRTGVGAGRTFGPYSAFLQVDTRGYGAAAPHDCQESRSGLSDGNSSRLYDRSAKGRSKAIASG